LTPDDPEKWFTGPLLARYALQEFGISCLVDKADPSIKNPALVISRSNNAFIFSGYNPGNTVRLRFRFPQGAPLLCGLETQLEKGSSTYVMPTAWTRECRIFIEQNEGLVSCKELHSGEKGISKRYTISGLQNAKVSIYPGKDISVNNFNAYINSDYPWRTGRVNAKEGESRFGKHFVVENVKGNLTVSW
jgi:hypothetical protein